MKHFLLAFFLLASLSTFAQAIYPASSGAVTSVNAVTGHLDAGGAFVSASGMGWGCYFGQCPAWQFRGYPFSYILPDGTTASFSNFAGTANFSAQSDVKVDGTASGIDSSGVAVNVTVHWEFGAFCRSGRGGGSRKTFLTGTLAIQ